MSFEAVVSFFKTGGEYASLLKQYVDAVNERHADAPFKKKDIDLFTLYFEYARNRCYRETDAHFEKVAQIVEAGPIFELAQKIQKTIRPMAALCEQGKERIERAKNNPAEGPRACHWLALYLNELNLASFKKDDNAMKAAIKKIDFIQRQIALAPRKSERTNLVNELCIQRLDQIDSTGSMRAELFTWAGYLKAQAVEWGKRGLALGLSAGITNYIAGCHEARECLYRRIGNVLGATLLLKIFQGTGAGVYNIWLKTLFRKQDATLIDQFTSEEKEKYMRIQKDVLSVASAFGMSNSFGENFLEITHEDSVWTGGSLWSNPILGMDKRIFDLYESKEAKEWRTILDELPDHPLDLARFLDRLSSERRKEIEMLAKKGPAFDQKTLQGVFAHELGHLRNHDMPIHALPIIFLQTLLQALIFYTDTETKWPMSRTLLVEEGFIPLFLPILLRIIDAPFSQYQESKADLHATISADCLEGTISFFKQMLVCEWVLSQQDANVPGSFEKKIDEMLRSFDLGRSHPNNAKRLAAAIERRGKPYEPTSSFFTAAKVAFATAVHLSLLGLQIAHLSYLGSDILFNTRDSWLTNQ